MVNCEDGPTDFGVQWYVVPAFDAQSPVANRFLPRPDAVQPVTLPSAIVNVSSPSLPCHAKVAPDLRPCSASMVALGPFHSHMSVPPPTLPAHGPDSARQLYCPTEIEW